MIKSPGHSRRVPLPNCRCGARLTRKAKNAHHKICDVCSARITEQASKLAADGHGEKG
jgi:hypothetical protein